MSFDRTSLAQAVARHGRVARIVIAETRGSAPRGSGTSMLVWDHGTSGTIGGGTLEFESIRRARSLLQTAASDLQRVPLGPALGQCCGGAVTLVTEVFDAERLAGLDDRILHQSFVRRIFGAETRPMSVRRLIGQIRNGSLPPSLWLRDGWLVEPMTDTARPLWIYGAGHVGRAVASVLAPLPDWKITWVDTAADRFPASGPENTVRRVVKNPAEIVAQAPPAAHHLVLTYSHMLDLELCHALLRHGFASAGLIGSATKWSRFRSRLRHLGHADAAIDRITCPIGDPTLGKHPQAIAVGVAARLLGATEVSAETAMDRPA